MSYRVVETPLGWLLHVGGEQVGEPHATPGGVFAAAMFVMKGRGEPDTGGTWELEYDGSYRWYANRPDGPRWTLGESIKNLLARSLEIKSLSAAQTAEIGELIAEVDEAETRYRPMLDTPAGQEESRAFLMQLLVRAKAVLAEYGDGTASDG